MGPQSNLQKATKGLKGSYRLYSNAKPGETPSGFGGMYDCADGEETGAAENYTHHGASRKEAEISAQGDTVKTKCSS